MKKLMTIALSAAVLMLTGCVAAGLKMHNSMVSRPGVPFYLAYGQDEVIREQAAVATITSSAGLSVDGVEVNPKNMRSTITPGALRSYATVVADLLPGTYHFKALVGGGGTIVMEPITFTVEAGHIYTLGNVGLRMVIIENTDTGLAQSIAENRRKALFNPKQQ